MYKSTVNSHSVKEFIESDYWSLSASELARRINQKPQDFLNYLAGRSQCREVEILDSMKEVPEFMVFCKNKYHIPEKEFNEPCPLGMRESINFILWSKRQEESRSYGYDHSKADHMVHLFLSSIGLTCFSNGNYLTLIQYKHGPNPATKGKYFGRADKVTGNCVGEIKGTYYFDRDDSREQLNHYILNSGKRGFLTNGVEWHFYDQDSNKITHVFNLEDWRPQDLGEFVSLICD